MLKRSIVSLTILKANFSTTSSHRSLANPLTEQDKELSEIHPPDNDKNQSSPVFVQRNRCPSAPLTMPSRIPEYPGSSHSRRSSVISGSSLSSHGRVSPDRIRQSAISESDKRFLQEIRQLDEVLRLDIERDSFAGRFSEGQLSDIEKDDKSKNKKNSWVSNPPPQPIRSRSYMSAVTSQRYPRESASIEASIHSDSQSVPRSSRPQSAPGSRQYISTVNGNRWHNLLLQNDAPPMEFPNWRDSLPQGHSLPKSVGRQGRNPRSTLGHYIYSTSGTLPLSPGRTPMDSDRRFPDHFTSNSMKKGHYMGRNHHRSIGSHASSTSSMSSGFTAPHCIRPVHEEDSMYVF